MKRGFMNKLLRIVSLAVMSALVFSQTCFVPLSAQAAGGTLSVLSDTMSRLKKSTNASHLIKFRTSVAVSAAADAITITFPSDFNLTSSAVADITFTHGASTGAEATEVINAGAPDAGNWGGVFSGTQSRILTLTAPTDGTGAAAVAANNYIIITYASTHAVNATTAGSYIIYLAITGANTANSSINIVVVDDDQVAVTATVDAALVFTISDTSIGFGNFIGTAIRFATGDAAGSASEPATDSPVKLTASGNGTGGLTISIRDEGSGTNPGLWNTVQSEIVPAAASTLVTTGSKKYGAYGKNNATLVIYEGFDNDSNADLAISRTAQAFATYNTVGGGSVDLALKAAIDATTKPGSYADTITLICTGNY